MNEKTRFDLSVLPFSSILGESPVWLASIQRLLWLDIEGEKLHRLDPENRVHDEFTLGGQVGCIGPCQGCSLNGPFLLAGPNGIEKVELTSTGTNVLKQIVHPERELFGNRYNDGKCSPEGRFFFGSLNKKRQPGQASLYRLDSESCQTVLTGATNSNGLGWSPEGTTFYWIDTPTRRVEGFDYSPLSGTLSNRRTVIAFPDDAAWGRPDGMTVDAEGMIWIAHWMGARITRWNPINGRLIQTVSMPVSRVTSLTFGGKNLETLFITTARHGMTPEESNAEPLAGNLFAYRPRTKGLPANEYRQ